MKPCVPLIVPAFAAAAAGDVLYSTDFESFALGSIHNQQGWTADPIEPGYDLLGVIADFDGRRVLRVGGPSGRYGPEVRRDYDLPSSRRYVQVVVTFLLEETTSGFWFMDNNSNPSHDPDALFWMGDAMATNANPGIPAAPITAGRWTTFGLEIDTLARRVIGANYDGLWLDEIDDQPTTPSNLAYFVFRGYNTDADPDAVHYLTIDGFTITDSDHPVVPAPATLALLGLAALGARRRA